MTKSTSKKQWYLWIIIGITMLVALIAIYIIYHNNRMLQQQVANAQAVDRIAEKLSDDLRRDAYLPIIVSGRSTAKNVVEFLWSASDDKSGELFVRYVAPL